MRRARHTGTPPSFRIEALSYSATRLVRLGRRKVAILFAPSEPGAPWKLYPHPDSFPGLSFEGLPAPLRPEFTDFANLDAVEAFLGIHATEQPETRLAA